MKKAALTINENDRLKSLKDLNILDTIEEVEYDDLTAIAAQICQTPIALISLIDENRQWFKSHHGLEARETPRDIAFCAHAILDPDEAFIIEDSIKDERFHDNPLVTGAPHVIFYAGIPLKANDGNPLGTLCVIDNQSRKLSTEQINSLKALGRQASLLFDLRLI
jgi:GAF domain-containing protein